MELTDDYRNGLPVRDPGFAARSIRDTLSGLMKDDALDFSSIPEIEDESKAAFKEILRAHRVRVTPIRGSGTFYIGLPFGVVHDPSGLNARSERLTELAKALAEKSSDVLPMVAHPARITLLSDRGVIEIAASPCHPLRKAIEACAGVARLR